MAFHGRANSKLFLESPVDVVKVSLQKSVIMTIPDLYQNQVLPTGMATTWVESLSSIPQMTRAMLEAEAGTEH